MDDTRIFEQFSTFNADLRELRTLITEQKPSVVKTSECLAAVKIEVAAVKHKTDTHGEDIRELKAFCDGHRGILTLGNMIIPAAISALVALFFKYVMR
jgi:hypothetical protein